MKKLSLGIASTFLFVTIAALAANFTDDTLQIGKPGSSADKSVVFGASNKKKLSHKPSTQTLDYEGNNLSVGDGLNTSDKTLKLNKGANSPTLRHNFTSGDLEIENAPVLNQKGNTVSVGDGTNTNKVLKFNKGASSPEIRYNSTTGKLQFTNDTTTYKDIGSGSGGGGGTNLLQEFNSDFESGSPPQNWTASGGTFIAETTDPLFGLQSGSWDSNASSQTLSSQLVTIEKGFIGKKCTADIEYKWPSGVAGDLSFQVVDQVPNILATVNLEPTTGINTRKAFLAFDCPSVATDQLRVRLLSNVANPALIAVDNAFVGTGKTVFEKPQDIFTAKVSSTGVVTDENSDWIVGNCTNAAATVCTFKSGLFAVAPNCWVANSTTSASNQADTNGGQVYNVTTGSGTFASINATGSSLVARDKLVACQKVESAANREALNLETTGQSWSGYHDSTCGWARGNVAYGDLSTDASCALVERTNSGFGTVTTQAGTLPGIVFNAPGAAKYWVCANATSDQGTAGEQYFLRLYDGTNTISETNFQDVLGSTGQLRPTSMICGIYNATSAGTKTISIQAKSSAGGTITVQGLGGNAIEWSIIRMDQAFPAPVFTELQNNVKTPGVSKPVTYSFDFAGASRGVVCSGACVLYANNGNAVASVTRGGAGDYTVNWNPGIWADDQYVCSFGGFAATAGYCGNFRSTPQTTSSMRVFGSVSGGINDNACSVVCHGRAP